MNKRAGFAAVLLAVFVAAVLVIGAGWLFKTKQAPSSQSTEQSSSPADLLATTEQSLSRKTSVAPLNVCGKISKPGTYSLEADITNTFPKPCITISANSVILDCANHTVTSKDENYAILVKGATDFKVQNCKVASSAAPSSAQTQYLLRVEASKRGEISKITLGGTYASVSDSSLIAVRNNSISSQFSVYRSTNVTLAANSFTNASDPLHLQEGQNNSVIGNTIDGRSDGIFRGATDSVGADDGIVVKDETGDTISGNTIKNVWDCGIETYGNFFDSKIINNRISNAGYCAIGGWHYSSVKGNLIQKNIGDNVGGLFNFHREHAFRTKDKYMYFKDNLFEGNTLINPRPPSALNPSTSVSSFLIDTSLVPASSILTGNNVFRNNNFTKAAGPILVSPSTIITDGGGNICADVIEYAERGTRSIPFSCN
jgi:parallel beta-helix repeat protein